MSTIHVLAVMVAIVASACGGPAVRRDVTAPPCEDIADAVVPVDKVAMNKFLAATYGVDRVADPDADRFRFKGPVAVRVGARTAPPTPEMASEMVKRVTTSAILDGAALTFTGLMNDSEDLARVAAAYIHHVEGDWPIGLAYLAVPSTSAGGGQFLGLHVAPYVVVRQGEQAAVEVRIIDPTFKTSEALTLPAWIELAVQPEQAADAIVDLGGLVDRSLTSGPTFCAHVHASAERLRASRDSRAGRHFEITDAEIVGVDDGASLVRIKRPDGVNELDFFAPELLEPLTAAKEHLVLATVGGDRVALQGLRLQARVIRKVEPKRAVTSPAPAEAAQQRQARELITAFRQGPVGNCATIGLIKAAMHAFGDQVFSKSEGTNDGPLSITLRDGTSVQVSRQQFEEASGYPNFLADNLNDARYGAALEIYAVMVAHRMTEGGHSSVEAAAKDLNGGERFKEVITTLGIPDDAVRHLKGGWLRRWWRKIPFLRAGNSCVAASPGHAWFVSRGTGDRWGQPVPLTSVFSSWFAFKATNAYCLMPQRVQAAADELDDGLRPTDLAEIGLK